VEAGNAARSPEFKQQSIDVKEVALLRHQLAEARLEIDELAAAADEALGDSEALRMALSLERTKLAAAELRAATQKETVKE
jgi:hypothetical protein